MTTPPVCSRGHGAPPLRGHAPRERSLRQAGDLEALGDRPTVEGIALALAHPVIDALAGGGQDLALFRIIVRATIDPPHGCRERLSSKVARRRTQLLAALRSALPEVDGDEPEFRMDCLIGMLDWLAFCAPQAVVEDKTEAELEQLLTPTLVGALTGASATQCTSPRPLSPA